MRRALSFLALTLVAGVAPGATGAAQDAGVAPRPRPAMEVAPAAPSTEAPLDVAPPPRASEPTAPADVPARAHRRPDPDLPLPPPPPAAGTTPGQRLLEPDGGVPPDAGWPVLRVDDGGLGAPVDAAVDVPADARASQAGPTGAGPARDARPSAEPPTVQPEPAGVGGASDFLDALREWMWERAERESAERESAERESAERELERRASIPSPTPTTVVEPRTPDDIRVVIDESVTQWLGFALPDRRMSSFGLLLLLTLTALWLWIVHRLRRPLPERGLFPQLLGLAHLTLRLTATVIVLMLISRILPAWLQPSLLLTVAAVAVAVGFGAVWTVLPDVVGGMVLLTEGRLRPGQWVTGEGFAGAVEHVGPRVTVLRAADGSLVTVPNRRVVKSPVQTSERRWHEVEVELRAPDGVPASKLRHAIREAVLSSPYIPPDPRLTLSRDPREPSKWRLRLRLLHVRYTAPFEGQLVERVEEAIAPEPTATAPGLEGRGDDD
jgi:hypothetical protein